MHYTASKMLLMLPHSMRCRVYITVGCPSVHPSVCPVDRQQQAGLRLSSGAYAADIYRQLLAAGSVLLRSDRCTRLNTGLVIAVVTN